MAEDGAASTSAASRSRTLRLWDSATERLTDASWFGERGTIDPPLRHRARSLSEQRDGGPVSPNHRAIWQRSELPAKAVADAGDGVDVGGLLGVRFDFATKAVDVGVDGSGLDLDFVSPHATEQFSAAHDLTGARGEECEQVEL